MAKSKRENYAITVRLVRRPDQKRVPKTKQGKTTDLGITQFILNLLEANEKLGKWQKMTDETIKAAIISEYPESKQVARLKAGKMTVGYWRGLYNSGFFTKGVRPKPQSYKYAFDGNYADKFGKTFRSRASKKQNAQKKMTKWEIKARRKARKKTAKGIAQEQDRYLRKLVKALNMIAWEAYLEQRNERIAQSRKERAERKARGPYHGFAHKKNTRPPQELRLDYSGSREVGAPLETED